MMMCASLAACGTAERPQTVSDVSCAAYLPISYAQLPAGQVDDPGNVADSDATVKEIDAHNARYDAICGAVEAQKPTRP